ncbi:MAG: 3-deoxy-D-manno-octulosonic acid kinase [Pseudomonadota bacterium]|nr:3-deoxy-D-manno-octulosonic acid kinase [Pseudomonadota bacterium]
MSIVIKKIKNQFIFYDKGIEINIEESFLNNLFSSDETHNVEWINNNKWVKKHYFRKGMMTFMNDTYLYRNLINTRSYREFEILNYLYKSSFNTCRPIMGWVSYNGIFYRANLITESIPAQTLSQYFTHEVSTGINERGKESLFQEIGKQIAKMHLLNIFHGDLNIHNILIKGDIINNDDIHVWILDFDKSEKKILTERNKTSNIDRLKRSFYKHEFLIETDYSKVLKGYESAINS